MKEKEKYTLGNISSRCVNGTRDKSIIKTLSFSSVLGTEKIFLMTKKGKFLNLSIIRIEKKIYPGPGLEPEPLAFRTSALTTKPPRTTDP